MIKYLLTSIVASLLTFILITIIFFYPSNSLMVGEKIKFQANNGEFKFTAIPSKGRDYKMMEQLFLEYKNKENIKNDIELFRITRKNYFRISKWTSYKTLPEWNYPYKK